MSAALSLEVRRSPAYLELPACAKRVLGALLLMAGPDGRLRWGCSNGQLARMTAYSERTVQRGLRWLEKAQLIDRVRGDGRQRSTYVVTCGQLPAEPVEDGRRAPETRHPRDDAMSPLAPSLQTRRTLPSTRVTRARRETTNPPTPQPSAGGLEVACLKAASRGRPCASCRACGTNPRGPRRSNDDERRLELTAAAPPWCGICDERTRLVDPVELGWSTDAGVARCIDCHPLAIPKRADGYDPPPLAGVSVRW